jgi:predicted amidohydrolase YtcJ
MAGPGRGHESTVVFVNADVVTMDERRPTAQAVAVRRGRILAVGDLDTVLAAAGSDARTVDLGGRALIPGFVDGHGDFTQVARELDWVDLAPPPAGETSSIAELLALLRGRLGRLAAEHKYILGVGYDDSMLDERRHPTKEDLDRVSTLLPIWVVHASRQMAVGNSMALDQAGIAASTPDPVGGTIVRRPDSREPTGLLEDAAWAHVRLTFFPAIPDHHHPDLLRRTGEHYARLGITTAHDGGTDVSGMRMLRAAAEEAALPVDVVCYPLYQLAERMRGDTARHRRQYVGRVRVGGLKIVLDGSPQRRSAWLTEPYLVPPLGEPASYGGLPSFADEDVYRMVADCFAHGVQLVAHANGDAAAEQLIEAVARAERRQGRSVHEGREGGEGRGGGQGRDEGQDRRPVMVSAQTVREDQLDRMRALGILPSFSSTHCFFWGDWHVASVLGRDRAYRMSPARSAARRGMRFSLHDDSPVVSPNVLFLLWSAVTRLSRGGEVIGADQQLTPAEALRAVTIDAAYQHFEEAQKGSLEVGKLADMVVLSDNPLRVAPEAIREITVLATLKEGVPIYVRERASMPESLATAHVGGAAASER